MSDVVIEGDALLGKEKVGPDEIQLLLVLQLHCRKQLGQRLFLLVTRGKDGHFLIPTQLFPLHVLGFSHDKECGLGEGVVGFRFQYPAQHRVLFLHPNQSSDRLLAEVEVQVSVPNAECFVGVEQNLLILGGPKTQLLLLTFVLLLFQGGLFYGGNLRRRDFGQRSQSRYFQLQIPARLFDRLYLQSVWLWLRRRAQSF